MFTTTKLQNGLTVLTAPTAGAHSVTVLAMVPVGSRYESNPVAGAAHFLEHMLFKGTKKRPSPTAISRTLDAVGADFNAFTSKEYTGYYVKVDFQFADRAVDILADMLFESLLAKEELNRERGVVIEEIRMYEDMPMRHVADLVEESLYPKHRLGRNIAGSEDSITDMKLADLRTFWQRYYAPSNMVVVLAGATDGLLELVEKSFGARHSGTNHAATFPRVTAFSKRVPVVQTKDTDQAHVVLAFPSLPYGHAGETATNLLANILGGTMSSRLFVEIREKRGLAYAVSADVDRYRDTGSFQIQAGLDRKRLPEALGVMAHELKKIIEQGITEEELEEAKSNIRGKFTLKLENNTELAVWYARGFLFYPEPWTPEQYLARVDGATVEMVNKMAHQLFKKNAMGVACVGPYTGEDFGALLRKAFK